MSFLKRVGRSRRVLALAGEALALYLRTVERTSRLDDRSGVLRARLESEGLVPYIVVSWHGEHFLSHIARRPGEDVRALVSRHGDGEINAVAVRRLGLGLVRGSGGAPAKMRKRGAVVALRALLRALEEGASVFLTADVPKRAKRVGEGCVTLARLSGRPVIPLAVVSRRHVRLRSWDEAAVPLPFSQLVLLTGEPVFVPPDAGAGEEERLRQHIETSLNTLYRKAGRLARRPGGRNV